MHVEVTTAVSTQVKGLIRTIFLEIGQQVTRTLLLLSSIVSVFSKWYPNNAAQMLCTPLEGQLR